jgi:hypothetical protein
MAKHEDNDRVEPSEPKPDDDNWLQLVQPDQDGVRHSTDGDAKGTLRMVNEPGTIKKGDD